MHTPRKRFGQNFLEDRAVVERLVDCIRPERADRMIEIGPGLAALTAPLLERVDRLDVVEIDRDIVRDLRQRFATQRIVIHEGDVLKFDFGAFGTRVRVVGNLPYNISTPILFHLSGYAAAIRDCHFMLQREVVQRMAAAPGGREYGRLSVMLQYRWRIEPLFDVPPSAFRPEPKVWSSVVRMVPHQKLPHAAIDERLFAQAVSLAFGQRRKTLRNALKALLGSSEIEQLGIDPGARGETLGVAEFVRISNSLCARAGQPSR